ncbi:sensor histidine kinase [Chryseolinea soli]|uniref:sensor histidine kinase n=1 Tax=Chryseolinea soli TaxID=2321403 RepID=UPI00135B21E7|nr:PAS domain-containing sensor histidine kinase [Chryseolinea soli]
MGTNLEQVIEKLRKSEERYHKMIAEVEDYAIILLDVDGIIQNWNRGAEKIKQYKEAEIVGKHFSTFYLPEDIENNLPETLLGLARENGRAAQEGWRKRKDGTRFWGSITITALHDDDGVVIGYSKVTRDLTERKIAEDQQNQVTEQLRALNTELSLSEQRYHQMIAEVQDYAIIFLDPSGNIVNWNTGAQVIKGYSSEIIGTNFNVFYTPEDRKRKLPETLLEHAKTHGKANHEGWRVRKNGSTFWGNTVITALHNKSGELIGFSKVTRDLTEKKMAEDRLVAYANELEIRNRELEQFAYVTSHDLQEPLRKIRTFTEIIQKNAGDSAVVSRYFEKINRAAERMTNLIKSVLNYSRLSRDNAGFVDVDLNEIMVQVQADFELLIAEKNATVHVGKLPVIQGDYQQLEQLFSNLVSNALKFTDSDPVIQIQSKFVNQEQIVGGPDHLPEERYVEILVADNGIGFEPKYADLIFTMFQRLQDTQDYAGTGIGLALCKKIIENHRGFITATSEQGKGANFYVYFPYKAQS